MKIVIIYLHKNNNIQIKSVATELTTTQCGQAMASAVKCYNIINNNNSNSNSTRTHL